MTDQQTKDLVEQLRESADYMKKQLPPDLQADESYVGPHTIFCEAADTIERLSERCEAYKGQVKAGSAEIERLTAPAPVDGDLRDKINGDAILGAIAMNSASRLKRYLRCDETDARQIYSEIISVVCQYAEKNQALLPARTPETAAAPRQGMELWRPDWFEVMKGCAFPVENHLHANELVSVTRETARLSLGALSNIMAQDYYHNHGAAAEELKHVLGEKQ